jgi:predicted amidophosphoribosyltransferase
MPNIGGPEIVFVLVITVLVTLVWFMVSRSRSAHPGKKQCAQCGEFVYEAARFCRFCGAPFR